MKNIIAAVLITLILVGCTPATRRQNYVRKNSVDWQTKEMILEGSIVRGMSLREVEASWGSPRRKFESVYGGMSVTTWVYGYGSRPEYIYFEHGYVVGWSGDR